MCDPISAMAVAAGAAGSGINAYETNRTQKAMTNARNAATQAELERQRAYQAQSGAEFDKAVGNFSAENQAQRLTNEQARVGDAFAQNAPTAEMVGQIGTGGAPRVVQAEETRVLGDSFTKGAERNKNAAKLAGWDQRAFGNKLDLNQSGRNLDLTADLSRTSAAVGGLEQNAAYKNAFRPNSGIGDLLQFAGQIGGYQAGKGGFKVPGATGNAMPAYNPNVTGGLY